MNMTPVDLTPVGDFGSTTDSGGYPQFRPLSGAKQTWISGDWKSVHSHKRSLVHALKVHHGRYVTFQLAEVAVPKELFKKNPEPDR